MKVFLRAFAVGVFAVTLPFAVCSGAVAAEQVSAADAAPFVGEWTLALQGPNGPGSFALSISVEKEKVSAVISSDALGKQPITAISLVDKSLVLAYSFMYEGNPVDAVAT